jgi:hypothetical protein
MNIKLYAFGELDIVQFSCLPRDEPFLPFSEKSKYLDVDVFSLFRHSFELSALEYNYYSTTGFDNALIVTLRNHLMTNQARITAVINADELEILALKQVSGMEFINALKSQDPEWRISWEKIKSELLQVGEDLIEIVDRCIDEDLVLWVTGF